MKSTVKVGVITLLGCALLVYMAFIIGDIRLTEYGYRFVVTFYSVNGLSQGASVSMAGVKIGKVEKVEIRDDQVFVHAYIRDKKVRIRRRSTFTIGTAGLMGEKFVDIIPTRDQTAPYVIENGQIEGTDPTRMEELFEQGTELLKKLQGLSATAKDIIGDPELKASTKAIFKNAETASAKVADVIESVRSKAESIVNNLDGVMAKVNGEMERNRDELHEIVLNVKEFTKNLKQISTENRENLKSMLDNMRGVSDRLEKMIDDLNKDKAMTQNLRSTVEQLRKASENAKDITKEVKEIVTDRDIRGKIKSGLDDAHKIAQAVDKVFLNIKQTRIDLKYLLRYNKEQDLFFSDMFVDVWPSDTSFYRVGVEDIGGDPLFNLTLARDADSKLVKRAGIISSKVGVGVDYRWAEDITYSLDVIDTRKSMARFTTSYQVRPGIQLQLRVDDITNDRDVNFGMEYRF